MARVVARERLIPSMLQGRKSISRKARDMNCTCSMVGRISDGGLLQI